MKRVSSSLSAGYRSGSTHGESLNVQSKGNQQFSEPGAEIYSARILYLKNVYSSHLAKEMVMVRQLRRKLLDLDRTTSTKITRIARLKFAVSYSRRERLQYMLRQLDRMRGPAFEYKHAYEYPEVPYEEFELEPPPYSRYLAKNTADIRDELRMNFVGISRNIGWLKSSMLDMTLDALGSAEINLVVLGGKKLEYRGLINRVERLAEWESEQTDHSFEILG
ncbi:unnamed protein product [Diplocarpon coronariae]|uniref:Uncharacterized protein n=1 Tax=Diplocarpon coronariae TaxID=2795749 RepID=A0A218Z630_9HELO|nr:hypothetical protein B2J93_7525 [Marssonina coronariae]